MRPKKMSLLRADLRTNRSTTLVHIPPSFHALPRFSTSFNIDVSLKANVPSEPLRSDTNDPTLGLRKINLHKVSDKIILDIGRDRREIFCKFYNNQEEEIIDDSTVKYERKDKLQGGERAGGH